MIRRIAITVFLVAFCHILFSQSSPRRITIGHHEDFPPYCYKKDGKLVGIFPEMVNLICKKMGVNVTYRFYPWKRLIREARSGQVDAVMPLFKSKERDEFLIYPTKGFALGESYCFIRKGTKVYYNGSLDSLRGISIGVVENYFYGEDFEEATYLMKEFCPNDEKLLEKLIIKHFKVGFSSDKVIRHYARQKKLLNQITFLKPPLVTKVLYVGFSKKRITRDFVKRFSEVARTLKTEHKKILEKHECADHWAFFNPLIVGIDKEDYHPYTYWDKSNPKEEKIKGACTELVDQAADLIGINIEYKIIDWTQSRELIKKGQIDAVIPLFKTKKRETFLYFPCNGLVGEKDFFFALKKNNILYSGDFNDLRKIPFGMVEDYSYGKDFDKFVLENKSKLKITEFKGLELLLRGLEEGEVKVAVGSKRAISYLAKSNGIFEKIQFLLPSLPKEFLFIGFTRWKGEGYKKLAESFSVAIDKMRRSGEYLDILKRNGIQKNVVNIAAYNMPPYFSPKLENNGPVAEIITRAFSNSGYETEITFIPWAQLVNKLDKGLYDAAIVSGQIEDTTYAERYSHLVYTMEPLVFCRRIDNPFIYRGLQDLKRYRIGVLRDYDYHPQFDNITGLRKIQADSNYANIQNLLRRRLDLVIMEKRNAEAVLEQILPSEREQIEILDLSPEFPLKQDLYLLFSRESIDAEQLHIDFNDGLLNNNAVENKKML